jgi:hypothetical protein
MTRPFIIFLGFILTFFCKQQPKTTGGNTISNRDTTKASNNNVSQLSFNDILKLPIGFTLDSTITFDSARNAEIQIVIPKYEGVTLFDKQLSSYIKHRLNSYRLSLDTLIQNEPSMLNAVSSSFYVDPVSVFKDDKIVSYCFIISSDHAGAAHPFTEYYSFNYDLQKDKQFAFSDYFNVRSKQDTQSFIGVINRAIDRPSIGVDKLGGIDFNIEKDGIAFNFDDYEIASYAEGIIKAKVAKQTLKQFVTNNNR